MIHRLNPVLAMVVVHFLFFLKRGSRPKLTWTILFQSFLRVLFGSGLLCLKNLYTESMAMVVVFRWASLSNPTPRYLYTFLLFLYTILTPKHEMVFGIGGAMLLTFYGGVELPIQSTDFLHIEHHLKHVSGITLLGAMLSVGSCTKLCQSYPCYYSSTDLVVSMGSIPIRWLRSGVVASCVMMTLTAWCVKVGLIAIGPLFASVFSPLGFVSCTLDGIRMSRLMPLTNSTDSEAQSEASTSTAKDDSNHAMTKNGEDTNEENTSKDNDTIDMSEIQQVNK
ncbi:hypothetical protein MKW98_006473 [Papaver atlanticum]|uniref:WAT1-related protein n=1 Tax=Papaver atlanticum TaxID=357466 RepID=A0AAD4SG21_9MAGN|nr:hypothetical protein MKW98_006473 [Papaver atlanticum]